MKQACPITNLHINLGLMELEVLCIGVTPCAYVLCYKFI